MDPHVVVHDLQAKLVRARDPALVSLEEIHVWTGKHGSVYNVVRDLPDQGLQDRCLLQTVLRNLFEVLMGRYGTAQDRMPRVGDLVGFLDHELVLDWVGLDRKAFLEKVRSLSRSKTVHAMSLEMFPSFDSPTILSAGTRDCMDKLRDQFLTVGAELTVRTGCGVLTVDQVMVYAQDPYGTLARKLR